MLTPRYFLHFPVWILMDLLSVPETAQHPFLAFPDQLLLYHVFADVLVSGYSTTGQSYSLI